ncbi:acyl carrier protein [Aestuariibacter sp. A3R04]|uniref:acyl carrier protein n=1 Tax=Aestuariibacter sp. A3R04 TaxID=2841571 RepID=UPI001C07F77E|nr:acyl carrier protein [Aestuariibacter sp. A3R04]MBU3020485.1 acyl carrier protein [Aestuariibacter sp. A3R04]
MNTEKEQILTKVREILVDLFELDPAEIVPEARLYEDLDIDSIDAVDLLVDLKKTTSVEVSPAQFKQVRTIQDVVDVFAELSAKA